MDICIERTVYIEIDKQVYIKVQLITRILSIMHDHAKRNADSLLLVNALISVFMII